MTDRSPSATSKIVSVASMMAVLPETAWLTSMTLPNARQTFIAAPARYEIHPIVFWCFLATAVLASFSLLGSLAYISIATFFGRIRTDRPLFIALNAIWVYIGVFALIAKLPGLTLLVRLTFTASSFGWFLVMATGLPIWGPVALWWFGTAKPDSVRWTYKDE